MTEYLPLQTTDCWTDVVPSERNSWEQFSYGSHMHAKRFDLVSENLTGDYRARSAALAGMLATEHVVYKGYDSYEYIDSGLKMVDRGMEPQPDSPLTIDYERIKKRLYSAAESDFDSQLVRAESAIVMDAERRYLVALRNWERHPTYAVAEVADVIAQKAGHRQVNPALIVRGKSGKVGAIPDGLQRVPGLFIKTNYTKR